MTQFLKEFSLKSFHFSHICSEFLSAPLHMMVTGENTSLGSSLTSQSLYFGCFCLPPLTVNQTLHLGGWTEWTSWTSWYVCASLRHFLKLWWWCKCLKQVINPAENMSRLQRLGVSTGITHPRLMMWNWCKWPDNPPHNARRQTERCHWRLPNVKSSDSVLCVISSHFLPFSSQLTSCFVLEYLMLSPVWNFLYISSKWSTLDVTNFALNFPQMIN